MKKEIVEMTPEERKEFEAFRKQNADKAKEAKKKEDRGAYKDLVDDTINAVFPSGKILATILGATKKRIYDSFNDVIKIKNELYGVKEGQQSHTWTRSDGMVRVILGYNVTDNYDDTANAGIEKVRNYISSLAKDEATQTLVNAILRLLRTDSNTETLKASRVMQLRTMAEDSGNTDFLDGVQIIEDAYRPAISKQYVKMQFKDEYNEWQSVHLGMTEATNLELDETSVLEVKDALHESLLPFFRSQIKQ